MEERKFSMATEHIEPEKLVIFAESKSELHESEIDAIERHLQRCSNCQEELDTLLRVERDLGRTQSLFSRLKYYLGHAASKRPFQSPSASRERSGTTIKKPLLRPVFVYILLLALLYPAWLGLRSVIVDQRAIRNMKFEMSELKGLVQQRGRTISDLTDQVQQYHQSSKIARVQVQEKLTYRDSEQREADITILPSDNILHMTFSIPPPYKSRQYDVVMHRGDDCVASWENIKTIDNRGAFSIYIEAQSLSAGRYDLLVTESDTQQPEEFVFSFSLDIK
jgi:hypothetical protein